MQHVNSINAVKFSNCIRFSTDENILKLFSSFDAECRKHILLSYFSSFKQLSTRKSSESQDRDIFARFGQILEHQMMIKNASQTQADESSNICNLSSELWANIISFVNMKDRLLICEQASTKLYDICQMKEAHTELIITKSFVRNALYDRIDLCKFHHIKRLCIDFVFCNPAYNYYKRNTNDYTDDLETKYYQIIYSIMRHSMSTLKRIEYNLTENAFRSFLGESNQWNKQYDGSLLDFVHHLSSKTNCKHANPFANIDALIWNEKEMKDVRWIPGGGKSMEGKHQWLVDEKQLKQFVHYLKHIKSLIIPNHFNLSSYPLVSQIWSNKHCYQHLQHLDINLKDIIPDEEEEDDDNVVTEIGHPLVIMYKLKRLQSLHLVLPVFKSCEDYYHALLATNSIAERKHFIHATLVDIKIQFEIDSYIHKKKTLSVIDTIWNYIIRHCTNIMRYKCVVNNQSKWNLGAIKETKHKYISKLNEQSIECISYESEALDIKRNMLPRLNKLNLKTLKELTLHMQSVTDSDPIGEYLKLLHLEKLKCLQSFKFIYGASCTFKKGAFIECIQKNVIGFLEYINSQKTLSSTLKYVHLLHEAYREKKYVYFFKYYVDHLSIDEKESTEITKLLTSITTKHQHLKIIELFPAGIRHQELQYLEFWCSSRHWMGTEKYGELNVTQWRKIKKSYFVDLKIRNEIDRS